MDLLKFNSDLEKYGSGFLKGDCYITLQKLMNLIWDVRGDDSVPSKEVGEGIYSEIQQQIESKAITPYSRNPILPVGLFENENIYNFHQVKSIYGFKTPAALVWCDVPIPQKRKSAREAKQGKQKRVNEKRAFFESCLEHYKKQTREIPATPEQLISYCIENPPQGYVETSKDKQKIHWREGGQPRSVQIRAFKDAFNSD